MSPPSKRSKTGDAKTVRVRVCVTGKDRSGILNHITGILSVKQITLADIEQVVLQGRILLVILLEYSEGALDPGFFSTCAESIAAFGMSWDWEVVPEQEIPVAATNEVDIPIDPNRYVLTLFSAGSHLPFSYIQKVNNVLTGVGLNIDRIQRLSRAIPAKSVQYIVFPERGDVDLALVGVRLKDVTDRFPGCELALQQESALRKLKKLVVFDMSMNVINSDVIQQLCDLVKVKRNCNDAVEAQIEQFKGISASVLEKMANEIQFAEGAEGLFKTLHLFGYKTALVTSAPDVIARKVAEHLKITHVYANKLETDADGKLTGKCKGTVINQDRREDIVSLLVVKERLKWDEVALVSGGVEPALVLSRKPAMSIVFPQSTQGNEEVDLTVSAATPVTFTMKDRNLKKILFLLHFQKP